MSLFGGHEPLADCLAQMATGSDGRSGLPGGTDDWSFTVDELLRVTASKPIVRSSPSTKRGNTNVVALVVDTTDEGDGDPPNSYWR
ncbi:MAG: hypothetical protein AAGC79_18900 [Pseudomonadota bacterium]